MGRSLSLREFLMAACSLTKAFEGGTVGMAAADTALNAVHETCPEHARLLRTKIQSLVVGATAIEREIPVQRPDKDANSRFALHRREMMLATAAALFPTHGASGETGSRNAQADVRSNAAPAVPIPAAPSLGIGKDRALVLGGG